MPAVRKRRPLDIWPAFVDATASLLMVVVFVLLLASVGQFFLSDALSNKEHALTQLNARVQALADLLSLQKDESTRLTRELTLRTASLEQSQRDLEQTQTSLQTLQQTHSEALQTIDAQRAETAKIRNELAELSELSLRLERDIAASMAAQENVTQKLDEETRAAIAARAQIELLSRQLDELRAQLASVSSALEIAEATIVARDTEIADLGEKLNIALAEKVRELKRYRSIFFGRLRDALAAYPDVQIVGDRFVLPSALLFSSGSANLDAAGREQVRQLAHTLNTVTAEIPADVDWVLQVDGHTDRRPISTPEFASNWELSSARAITIVKALIDDGVAPDRVVAAGFAEHRPIVGEHTAAAYARNRRIELKLTNP